MFALYILFDVFHVAFLIPASMTTRIILVNKKNIAIVQNCILFGTIIVFHSVNVQETVAEAVQWCTSKCCWYRAAISNQQPAPTGTQVTNTAMSRSMLSLRRPKGTVGLVLALITSICK